eukprot:COSAG02_NODE_29630_length_565_cov_41.489270_2_plen_47_part_01
MQIVGSIRHPGYRAVSFQGYNFARIGTEGPWAILTHAALRFVLPLTQ